MWLLVAGILLLIIASVLHSYCGVGIKCSTIYRPTFFDTVYPRVSHLVWVVPFLIGISLFFIYHWIVGAIGLFVYWFVMPLLITPFIRKWMLPSWGELPDEARASLQRIGYSKSNYLNGDWWKINENQYEKIWHDILNKSDIPKEIIDGFFIEDKVDPLKFKENHDYYVMDRYGDHKPTLSCFSPLDAPLAYPYWFLSAYPDVVKYFAYLPDDELDSFLKGLGLTTEDLADSNCPKLVEQDKEGMSYYKVNILHKMKEHYKELHPKMRLECQ